MKRFLFSNVINLSAVLKRVLLTSAFIISIIRNSIAFTLTFVLLSCINPISKQGISEVQSKTDFFYPKVLTTEITGQVDPLNLTASYYPGLLNEKVL
jgi:hypothetical protein